MKMESFVLPQTCPLCGSVARESFLTKAGERQTYSCECVVHVCGHVSGALFGLPEQCLYLKALRIEAGQQPGDESPLAALARFKRELATGEGWGRVSFDYDAAGRFLIHAYAREGHTKSLPEEFAGYRVLLTQLGK